MPKNGCALGLALDGSGVVGIFSDQNTAVLTLVGVNAALCSSVATMIINQAAQSGRYESEYTVADSVDAIPALEKIRASIKADNQNRNAQKKYLLVIYDLPKVYRNLPDEQRTLLDKFILHGGSKLGIDCLFTAEPNQLAELPDNDGGVIPASVSLFRRPMLYLDNAVTGKNIRFQTSGHMSVPIGMEDAEYVEGFDENRHATRIRRMLNR